VRGRTAAPPSRFWPSHLWCAICVPRSSPVHFVRETKSPLVPGKTDPRPGLARPTRDRAWQVGPVLRRLDDYGAGMVGSLRSSGLLRDRPVLRQVLGPGRWPEGTLSAGAQRQQPVSGTFPGPVAWRSKRANPSWFLNEGAGMAWWHANLQHRNSASPPHALATDTCAGPTLTPKQGLASMAS